MAPVFKNPARAQKCHWCGEFATCYTPVASGDYLLACNVHKGPGNLSYRPSQYRGRQITETK